jgi:hypothetical protein
MADLLADGNIKATWVPSIADVSAPTIAELTDGTAVDLECLILLGGLDIKAETGSVDNSALCSTDDTEEPGRNAFTIMLTCKRKDTAEEDTAWNTLTFRALGNLVVRRDRAAADAYAADQPVEVYPARCGLPMMLEPEKNSVQKFQVKLFNNSTADTRATVAA